ncbi:hypothetical protein SAMN05444920_11850 [Nonomuraea solani]|uniref:Uncharacterized protein n=1 Tax=Nonomuraea solani TaxID=1144553 RepID=A0A1H6EUU7_9ACTN|nr:hypothetical protein [Nonomuraea solani]SEH00861.1 hypothetical protein SAMN05444920_11850 [Nonomuraea solani]
MRQPTFVRFVDHRAWWECQGPRPVALIELAELLVIASQADLESFNLAEPSFAFGLGNAGDEEEEHAELA